MNEADASWAAMARRWKVEVVRTLKASWKFCLSFFTKEWKLCDYPIEVRLQAGEPAFSGKRWQQHAYLASVIRWHVISGTGDSVSEAMRDLEKSFAAVKAQHLQKGEGLPRPGTHVPIQFAPANCVEAHRELLDDFIHRALLLEWALITDESCLWHFHSGDSNDIYVNRILEVYGVDVADIESGNIGEILDRIAASNGSRLMN